MNRPKIGSKYLISSLVLNRNSTNSNNNNTSTNSNTNNNLKPEHNLKTLFGFIGSHSIILKPETFTSFSVDQYFTKLLEKSTNTFVVPVLWSGHV